MYNIPEKYLMDLSICDAFRIMCGPLKVVEQMEHLNEAFERSEKGEAFYSLWRYEVNAYNKIYSTLKPYFEEAKKNV